MASETKPVATQVQDTISWIESLPPCDDINVHKEQRQVLPTDITPKHYFVSYNDIDLEKDFKFRGRAEIDLVVKNANTSEIKLNSCELDFKKVCVIQKEETQDIEINALVYEEKSETMTIPLKKALQNGEAKLMIEFIGNLNDKMKGFYRSKYKLSNGNDGFCGVTQFEATDARRALPCWDEPAIKATFSVEITCDKSLTVLSNMPIINTTSNSNDKTVLFDKTPVMSTYLLAWIVGEFECIESKTNRDILVRVWTTIGNKSKGEFACDVACRCLDFYESYFSIDYPLPKCDMIAVPDFAAGAMENWGLVTYREVALLCDKEKASLTAKQYVCIVVCHELAHQWFGNLVTMEWWSQLWLNEGFACFMEYLSTDALYPQWKTWQNSFLTSEFKRAFELDGMLNSHPIEVEVSTAAEAEEVFDTISYCKGACVIRMLESFLGANVFKSALSKYLNHFKYANAVTTDLWQFLSDESQKSIALIMKEWTQNQGFPLITASYNADNATLSLKQERFLTEKDGDKKEDETVWTVPMNLRITEGNKYHSILFNGGREQSFVLPKETQFVHINADSTGFYCCNYGRGMSASLSNNLSSLSIIDRMCLVRDKRALATCVSGATVELLDLIVASKDETEYSVWNALLSAASDIAHICDEDEEIMDAMNAIMVDTLSNIFNKLGFEEEKEEDETTSGLFRPLILSAMAQYKNEGVIEQMMKRFHSFMDGDQDALPSHIRRACYSHCIKNGGQEEFEKLKKYYLSATDAMEKTFALRSLGYVNYDDNAINDLLQWIMTSDDVRSQDKVFPFRVCAHSASKARQASWHFLKSKWDQWFKMFEGGFLVQHLAKIPDGFVTLDKAKEVEDFYATIDEASCERSMKQCIETIKQNANWRTKELENIRKWVRAKIATTK
eukprot:477320_1